MPAGDSPFPRTAPGVATLRRWFDTATREEDATGPAHRIDWLTPLAADPAFRPQTEALALIRPHLAALADGASTTRICRHILSLGRMEAA